MALLFWPILLRNAAFFSFLVTQLTLGDLSGIFEIFSDILCFCLQVQSLYADGHEIASHGISHSFGEQFSQVKL